MNHRPPDLRRAIVAIIVFGVAFGFVEAAVVVYLRAIYEPVRRQFLPDVPSSELFPLIRVDQLESTDSTSMRHLRIELLREAATLVMLAAVGMAVGRNARQSFAAFLAAFGVWDVAFYAFLKLMIDWPASLLTWDLLFLLPVPWSGPVIAPLMVAMSMIGAGLTVLAWEAAGCRFYVSRGEWAAICTGGLIVVIAFCWDYRNIMAGGWPRPFHWPLFLFGEGLGLAGFLSALRSNRRAGMST